MGIKLSPAGRRLTVIIVATPFMVTTSWILYKRVILGEERRVADGSAIRPIGVKEHQSKDDL